MKFHLQAPGANVVTGVGPGWIRVGDRELRHSVVLTPDAIIDGWAPAGFDALTASDYAALLEYAPELVLIGTGAAQRLAHPRLTQSLAAAHVGIEMMDTPAACRTFNILVAEGRRVVAALELG